MSARPKPTGTICDVPREQIRRQAPFQERGWARNAIVFRWEKFKAIHRVRVVEWGTFMDTTHDNLIVRNGDATVGEERRITYE